MKNNTMNTEKLTKYPGKCRCYLTQHITFTHLVQWVFRCPNLECKTLNLNFQPYDKSRYM